VLKIFGTTAENFSPGVPDARDLRPVVCSHLNLSGYYTNQLVSRPKIPHFAQICTYRLWYLSYNEVHKFHRLDFIMETDCVYWVGMGRIFAT
jgi:hypothetical protein